MGHVVLITGVSGYLGSRLAASLSDDPDVERVIGVDTAPPSRADHRLLGRTEFVRADIRNPLINRVLDQTGIDTVVHAALTSTPRRAGGRAPMKELNVIGTMQLLAACQRTPSVRRLVVKSTTAVYGSSPRDPAVFTEATQPLSLPRSGYAKDAVEVESYVRSFARRRPEVTTTVLRFANFVGPQVDSTLTRYFAMPLVPVAVGFDPRLQVLHEADAVETMRRAAVSDRPGVFNVAGDGVLLLSQAIRRAGRLAVPVPSPAVTPVSRLVRSRGLVDFSNDQAQMLAFGRVVDTTRLRTEFGYTPAFSTEQAFEAFITGAGLDPVVAPRAVRRVEAMADALLGGASALLGVTARRPDGSPERGGSEAVRA